MLSNEAVVVRDALEPGLSASAIMVRKALEDKGLETPMVRNGLSDDEKRARIEAAMTDIGITGGGKGNNMLYLSGVQNEKVLTKDIIEKVVTEVEKKASELEN